MSPDMASNLAEEKLRSREQHFRALIENSSDAIAPLGFTGGNA